ncbi:MAG: DUF1801 domain-containing protein [Jiangellales bacterium]
MAELKTKPTDSDVEAFIAAITDERVRDDCRELVRVMGAATGAEPVMWGTSIVGFGDVHYRYASGREGDWFKVGFSPRKRTLTLYLMDGVDAHTERLDRLGPHSTGKGCLYVKRLSDVDAEVLGEIITEAATR